MGTCDKKHVLHAALAFLAVAKGLFGGCSVTESDVDTRGQLTHLPWASMGGMVHGNRGLSWGELTNGLVESTSTCNKV